MKNYAQLRPDSKFHPVFPGGKAPIQNLLGMSEQAVMIGQGVHEFYRLDVAQLTNEQIHLIAHLVALQCGGTPEEVEAHMRAEKFIPLRAVHVQSVVSDSLAFL